MKIVILGIGGVGGYYGGMLARHYHNSGTKIYFIARGENEKVIKQHGLKVETTKGNFTAIPEFVTSNPSEIGKADLLVCCTKTYGLEEAIKACAPCISRETIILPLLNGIDSVERIKVMLPENEVWDGCVYLVAKLAAPGVIKETGNAPALYFGSTNGTESKLQLVEKIFQDAGLNAHYSKNILQAIWEKFLFIAPAATLTSYLDKCFGEILEDEKAKQLLQQLITEIKPVAEKIGVVVTEKQLQSVRSTIEKLPYETTTSMCRDFRNGNKTEVDSLTGYVVRLGERYGIATPTYNSIYQALKERSSK